MSRLTDLLSNLPQPFSRDPQGETAITVSFNLGATFVVDNLRLRSVVDSGTSLDIDLRDITLTTLASLINAVSGYTATVFGDLGDIKAYTLIDGEYDGSGAITVSIPHFTSTNYQLLAPAAEALSGHDIAWGEALANMDLRLAHGVWLDRIGSLYGIVRAMNEPDASYAQRITLSVVAAKANGKAIEQILSTALGIPATIEDVAPGRFTTTIVINDSAGNPYDIGIVNGLIDQYKTFGTLNTTVLTTTASELFTFDTSSDDLEDGVDTSSGEFGRPEFGARESGL